MEEVAEPFLVREGLLARTPRGRVATPTAWRHLGLSVPSGAMFAEADLFSIVGTEVETDLQLDSHRDPDAGDTHGSAGT